ncbi:hypothetical protein ACUOA8_35230 [Escherichia sp. SS-MK2]
MSLKMDVMSFLFLLPVGLTQHSFLHQTGSSETEDYEALERYRDEVLTLKTPFNIVLNMINDALQGEAA